MITIILLTIVSILLFINSLYRVSKDFHAFMEVPATIFVIMILWLIYLGTYRIFN